MIFFLLKVEAAGIPLSLYHNGIPLSLLQAIPCHMLQYVNVLQTSSIEKLQQSEEFVRKLIAFKRL